MADKLPSSLMMQAWMRDTVYPEARVGKRTVVCLVSHRPWGLERGVHQGVSLFSPVCTDRGAYMLHSEREPIAQAVRQAVFKTAA